MMRIDDRIGEGVIPHMFYLGVHSIPKSKALSIVSEIITEMDGSDLDQEVEYFVEKYVHEKSLPRTNKKKFKFFKPA